MVPRREASDIIPNLLKRRIVDESFQIKSVGGNVLIPLKDEVDFESGYGTRTENFEARTFQTAPLLRIRSRLSQMGIEIDNIPEKWIRLGLSITARFPETDPAIKHKIGSVYADVLNVKSVYEITGRIKGQYREPGSRLIYGPGGEIKHLENGIRFIMDPERVMFSPGNVNIRTAVRDMDLEGKTAIDMFSGIGYFSLGIAKYSGIRVIHSCEINPTSHEYLIKNVKLNKLEGRIIPHLGDSRIVAPLIRADVVIMGNFLSLTYLPHALQRLKSGGTLLIHDLSSTEQLDRYKYDLSRRMKTYGWKGVIEELRVVKSFAPHMWHVYVKVNASHNRP